MHYSTWNMPSVYKYREHQGKSNIYLREQGGLKIYLSFPSEASAKIANKYKISDSETTLMSTANSILVWA